MGKGQKRGAEVRDGILDGSGMTRDLLMKELMIFISAVNLIARMAFTLSVMRGGEGGRPDGEVSARLASRMGPGTHLWMERALAELAREDPDNLPGQSGAATALHMAIRVLEVEADRSLESLNIRDNEKE